MSEEEYYDPERAAKMLYIEPEEVYEMLESGELEGEKEKHPGRRDTWRIPSRAVMYRPPDEPQSSTADVPHKTTQDRRPPPGGARLVVKASFPSFSTALSLCPGKVWIGF